MSELRYPAGWVPAMAPGPDPDEADDSEYASDGTMVWCDVCGEYVHPTSARYYSFERQWVCDTCADDYCAE